MRRRPEDQLQDRVMAALGSLPGVVLLRLTVGVYYTRTGQLVRVGVPGTPDLLALVDGRAVGLELKTETGRLSPVQVQTHTAWRSMGTPVEVCRSVEEAIAAVEARRAAQ